MKRKRKKFFAKVLRATTTKSGRRKATTTHRPITAATKSPRSRVIIVRMTSRL